ncbi:MAG: PIN domain-containing protein [Verrucomicrobiota bacterium]|nr:PIN domain-containing protein [Verrucomicrobiota bacterium]
MRAVFADTFYFLAYLNRGDANHQSALAASKRFEDILTTAWILIEVADAFAASASRQRLVKYIHSLELDSNTTIIPATDNLFQRGLQLYDSRPDKNWALTDCISFVVMEENNLTQALTGDHHFEQAGFKALLK